MTRGRDANHAYITPDPATEPDHHHGPRHPAPSAEHTAEDRALDVLTAALATSGAQGAAHTARATARSRAAEETRREAVRTAAAQRQASIVRVVGCGMDLSRPLAVVTPTLDGDVLAVLARQDGTLTTGQVHRVLAQYSEEGVRKVLQRLTQQGTVRAERVGNAYAYQLNREHLAAEHIIALADLMGTFLGRLSEALGAWEIPPVYAAVFGSAARGTMSLDSDLDLLLVRPDHADEERWDAQVDALVEAVSGWLGNDTRPLQFAAAELAAAKGDLPVLAEALREGLTVAGDRRWLAAQLRAREA